MKIALDFDETITKDEFLWADFIKKSQVRGHDIRIVTMRFPEESRDVNDFIREHSLNIPVIYTGRLAKQWFFNADVWIDDSPIFVTNSAFPFVRTSIDQLVLDGVVRKKSDGFYELTERGN